MACLLAIPIAVPITIMKVTGTSGKVSDTSYLADPQTTLAVVTAGNQAAAPPEVVTPQEQREAFLKVSNKTNTFERFCRPYYTAGFNAYDLVESAMVAGTDATIDGQPGASIVDAHIKRAAESGLNTIRIWGHTTNHRYPFQVRTSPSCERGTGAVEESPDKEQFSNRS